MPSSLTPEERQELNRLVKKVIDDKRFIPDECYEILYSLFPQVIVEVLIYDDDGRFILKHRNDEHFVGWHVPGGRAKTLETIEEACNRHVRLDKVAEAVTDVKVIGIHVQERGEHPYGFPVCIFTVAKAVDPIIETDDCKWFSEAPSDLIPPPQKHDKYIETFQNWFRSGLRFSAVTF